MSSPSKPTTRTLAAALLLVVALWLVACGGSEPEPALSEVAVITATPLPAPVIEVDGQVVTPPPTPTAPPATATSATSAVTAATATSVATATSQPSPTPTQTPVPSPTPLGPTEINGIPLDSIVPLPPAVVDNIRAISARGRELGRNPAAFSKLGDSTVLNPHFLGPFDLGTYNLGEWSYLQTTIDRYPGSFKRHGVAARFGMHSWTVFDPMWADKKWCEPNEDTLACEFRLNNPSLLFVRLGSNDAGAPSGFRYNLALVIRTSMEQGIIPIIGTKADRFEGSNENNEILRALAAEYNVPLWDFDVVAETIPNRGLGDDNVHLKIEDLPHDYTQPDALQRGHALQDLTALIMLDQIRRALEE